MIRRSTIPTVLVLSALAVACADTPTTPPPTAADAAPMQAFAAALTPKDFDYEVVRHPDGGHTYVNRINARGNLVGDHCVPGVSCWGFARRGDSW